MTNFSSANDGDRQYSRDEISAVEVTVETHSSKHISKKTIEQCNRKIDTWDNSSNRK